MAEQPTVKPRRGCLFYGCITGVVCLIAMLLALLLGLHELRRMLNQYTDTKPATLPTVQLSPAQIDQVERRWDSFRDAIRASANPPPLELTADDINALIENDPDFRPLKGVLYVEIEGDELKGQLSVPMDQLELFRFRGRYLNGTGLFSLTFQNGLLRIVPEEIWVKGRPLPNVYMERIRRLNFAAQANENARSSVALNRLQSIQIKGGKLIIVPKVEQ